MPAQRRRCAGHHAHLPTKMLPEKLIQPDNVLCNAHARSKKHCLEILSELLVRGVPDIANDDVFEGLIERERLGCTSLNEGVAFPHCRVEGLRQSVAALIKLSDAVDFDAPDDEPVDLVFGLAVPADLDTEHQNDIGDIAELLGDPGLRARMRDAKTSKELYQVLCG
jgi:PTS system nitrogen regulatory IIA component